MKKIPIIIISIAAVGALLMAGFFAAIIGILLLPLFLIAKKQNLSMPKTKEPSKPTGNVIEADFKRVDKLEE